MKKFRYIMVTHFLNHWRNGRSSYRDYMLQGEMQIGKIKDNIPTTFIRLNEQTHKAEKAWKGWVQDSNIEGNKISFTVEITEEIEVQPEHSNYAEGWYIEEVEEEKQPIEEIYPPFFNTLKITTNWRNFEDLTYKLLKLLGIHEIYRYEEQSGKADGFFQFRTLVVIYDCTLRNNYETDKGEQINNYCAQLNSGNISYQGKDISTVGCHQQVWIITRGKSHFIKDRYDVVVKEVPINKIIQIYRDRLENKMDEKQLEKELSNI